MIRSDGACRQGGRSRRRQRHASGPLPRFFLRGARCRPTVHQHAAGSVAADPADMNRRCRRFVGGVHDERTTIGANASVVTRATEAFRRCRNTCLRGADARIAANEETAMNDRSGSANAAAGTATHAGKPDDPRREPRPGYAEPELKPKRHPPKAPGEGGPFEPQNNPRRKPGRQNG